ncbi:MAG: YdbL family protein [Candidatus Rokubacteria bacterium]|nr:YdbL family protein [Candidatus Rokubacteria bacterium]
MTFRRMTSSGGRLALALGLLTGCLAVTINVTFPQEKIEKAASSIEDLVRGGKEGPPVKPPPAKEEKRGDHPGFRRTLGWLAPTPAEAQVPELRTRTPEVMASIESRRQRFPQVQQWKERGCLGENAQGLLEARPGQGCASEVAALIAAENRDRMTLYRTLLQQNNMPPADLARVQAAFAKVNRERAARGEWIQTEDGRWVRK